MPDPGHFHEQIDTAHRNNADHGLLDQKIDTALP